MFDIDKYLDDLQINELSPTEELLARTKRRCEETEAKKKKRIVTARRIKIGALIALPAAAVLAVGIIIGAKFFSAQTISPGAVAYYTVDINPSLCLHVGADNTVTGLVGQNDDAQELIGKLDCVGESLNETMQQILAAAQDAGYFSDGQRRVLIGCFSADGTIQSALGGLQAQLEANFGEMIDLLIVSGTLEDKQLADTLRVSAGLLKLSQLADGVEISDTDKVDDVVDRVTQVNQKNYCAPALSVGGDTQSLKFSWNTLDFDAMGYTGKVKYHIVMAGSSADIAGMSGRTLETVSFNTIGAQTTSMMLKLADYGLKPRDIQYFGIYAEYGDVTVACSPVRYTIPAESEATPTPSSSSQAEPTVTPAPVGHTVSGRVSGKYVILSWGKETRADFTGYKIVASRTNPTPSYPTDGYIKYITNADITSVKLYDGYGDLKAGTSYYFSVTYLFKDGSTIAANAVKLKVPSQDAGEEEPEPSSGDYVSTNISGSVSDDGKIRLSWGKISRSAHPDFDGYKVAYSFTDSTPVYGESGSDYVYWFEDDATISCSFYPSKIGAEAGQKVYFSITALYDSHSVKKAGNAISLVMSESSDSEEPYVSTNISGSISADGVIRLSWGEVSHSDFCYYKVVYSFSDSTPVYGDGHSELYTYYDDSSSTGCRLDACDIGLEPGQTVYFSITVVYGNGTRKAGNSVKIVMPSELAPTPTPECTPEESEPCEG